MQLIGLPAHHVLNSPRACVYDMCHEKTQQVGALAGLSKGGGGGKGERKEHKQTEFRQARKSNFGSAGKWMGQKKKRSKTFGGQWWGSS